MIINAWINISSLQIDQLNSVKSQLSEDDLRTYDSYYMEEDKHRMLSSRFILDRLLDEHFSFPNYLNELKKEPSGKPILKDFKGLSISHSGQYAFITLSKDYVVGNDIQKRVLMDEETIFSTLDQMEIEKYKSLPKADQLKWFQKTWCEKEAILKAEGVGLEVEPSLVLTFKNQGYIKGKNNKWFIYTPPRNISSYEMAICTSSEDVPIFWFEWSEGVFHVWK